MEINGKHVAGGGTTALGIIGTSLGGLALGGNGILGNILGGNTAAANCYVNRYELEMSEKLGQKDAEIAYLQGQNETDKKIVETYKDLNGQIAVLREKVCENEKCAAVFQTAQTAAVSAMGATLANVQQILGSITRCVVPNSSICPGWGDVNITPAAAATTA
jgi:putative hemolysin